MMSLSRRRRIEAGFIALWLLAAIAYGVHRVSSYPAADGSWVRSPSLRLDLRELAGLQDFHGQIGQDKWITGVVFPGVADGYFVDVGSWDAILFSNSKALEDLGWEGVCVDPFPANWRDRRCQLFREVAYSEPGEVVRFRTAGGLGGIDEHIDKWKELVKDEPVVEFTTTTLADILKRSRAPRFIHYVSIDTEGSELEILQGFPFDSHEVGAFSIEHNFEEPKRSQIRALLEARGYRIERDQDVEDW
jgi:hypothetical protein